MERNFHMAHVLAGTGCVEAALGEEASGEGVCFSVGQRCRLTLALSPSEVEREQRRTLAGILCARRNAAALALARSRSAVLPLPWREGWGEGIGRARTGDDL